MSLLVRPTAPSLWLGVAVAASFIVAETLLVHLLMGVAPGNTFGAVYLLGVLVVSARWGFGLSAMTTLASTLAYGYVHFVSEGSFRPTEVRGWVAVFIFLPIALLANVVAGQARLRTAEADQRRREAEASRDAVRVLADQQAALRRSRATLVARRPWCSQQWQASWPGVWVCSRGLAATRPMDRPSRWRPTTSPQRGRLPVGDGGCRSRVRTSRQWCFAPDAARMDSLENASRRDR
jgi:hypothetical protein